MPIVPQPERRKSSGPMDMILSADFLAALDLKHAG
jgi:hypothetical protein